MDVAVPTAIVAMVVEMMFWKARFLETTGLANNAVLVHDDVLAHICGDWFDVAVNAEADWYTPENVTNVVKNFIFPVR